MTSARFVVAFVLALGLVVAALVTEQRAADPEHARPPHVERPTAGVRTSTTPPPTTTSTPMTTTTTTIAVAPAPDPPSVPAAQSPTAPPPGTPARVPDPSDVGGFLACVRARESDTAGGYQAVNPAGPYYGAYQFLQSTWDATARHIGRDDLAGIRPDTAPADVQDLIAAALYAWQGGAPWAGTGC